MARLTAELVVEQGQEVGRVILLEGPVAIVGRGGETTGDRIALAESGVSRQHARIQQGPQGWVLTDLGSTNGTFVNGQQLAEQQPHVLHPGDRVRLAGATLVFQAVESQQPAAIQAGAGKGKRRPVVLVVGALVLVLALAGLVVLLVVLLRPTSDAVTPTAADPVEQMMTALPVPTELQDVATAVIPLIPTMLEPLLGPQDTPTPEAAAGSGP